MADQPQNGKPQMPQIPEGELFLLVRLNPKNNEFQCLFSDLLSGLALHKLGGEFIEQNFTRKMFAAPEIHAAPGIPGFDPKLLSHFRKGPGGN
jgi:hypothetical protein